jgi:hypothetical protein
MVQETSLVVRKRQRAIGRRQRSMAPEPRRGSECSASGVEAYHPPAGDEDVSQTDLIAIEMGSQDGPRCFTRNCAGGSTWTNFQVT